MANIARVSVYLSTNTSEECRKGAAIPSRFPWSLWLQEGETLTVSGLCLLTSHSYERENSFTWVVVIHFHIDPFSQSNSIRITEQDKLWESKQHGTIREGSLFHRWIWRLQHRRQGRCVRVCVCEGPSKNLPNEKDESHRWAVRRLPPLYPIPCLFLLTVCKLITTSPNRLHRIAHEWIPLACWQYRNIFLGCAGICEHTYVISPASASWFSHAESSRLSMFYHRRQGESWWPSVALGIVINVVSFNFLFVVIPSLIII